ncbi:PREDICTED: coiled-coil domain-containing protein 14 [Dipodomys ordii]|uniref:Coiled-coil domain-containing protein 14 n=1 Tax=Dipodomys ordii TaxID=10020 RepID=A0A1S3FFF2_DIPOR|nr:PREDICTED: coiled-coil domain-containing protein 14 [Dipodomys ordii]
MRQAVGRGERRAPYRKRKTGGRAKGDRKSAAVNSIYSASCLLSICVLLRLREMVRSGSRPGQVLSSGRPPGSARITHGKKGTHLRKVSCLNADSGCPGPDLGKQTRPVQGLDGCASLLRDILNNEDSGSEVVYSENKSNSRLLESKKCDSKQKRREKHIVPSVVRKEIWTKGNPRMEERSKNRASNMLTAKRYDLPLHSLGYRQEFGLLPNIETEPVKAVSTACEDSEIQRLVAELEACISGLLAKSGNINTQVEIALAMQPLRSENVHLRRQLKILNQRLREQEITAKASSTMKCNLELFSLQSLNMSLQNQLQESIKSQELLQSKNEELLKVIENQKDENKKFTSLFKDKDQTLLENKQQFDIEMTRIKIELEEALVNVKNSQFKLETAEKENKILGITLRQRDAEVTRLRELTRTLQNSMAKLLSDLSVDTARCKPGNNLTRSLLNIYDKQLEQNPAPLHTSIMSYLNKLETNNSFVHSELLSTIKNEETIDLNSPYENVLPPKGLPHNDTSAMEGISVPGNLSILSKQGSDVECETMTLIEGCNLDNTIYIPLARSTSKKHSPLPKRVSPQPKISVSATQLVSNSTFISETKNKLCAPAVDSSKNETEDVHPNLSSTADMEDIELLKKIKEAIGKIPAATEDTKDQTAHHSPAVCHATSVQRKGNANAVCDDSCLNSDLMSDWSISSFSTFTSHDEQDFRNGLAALDANIARLQKSLRIGLLEK